MSSAIQFWDTTFASSDLQVIECIPHRNADNRTEQKLFELLSDVEGMDVLEVGCGTGELSVYMAKRGAHVTATDLSQNAIARTRELSEANQVVGNMSFRQIDALSLSELERTYDLIVGKFILHHIEPFSEFVDVLYDLLKEGGKIIFMENSSRNPLLTFARNNLAGRFGIPKHGDFEEHPLEPTEVKEIEERFDQSRQEYPEFVFFSLLNTYVFQDSNSLSTLRSANRWIDNWVYSTAPFLRKYSYYQIIEAKKTP